MNNTENRNSVYVTTSQVTSMTTVLHSLINCQLRKCWN